MGRRWHRKDLCCNLYRQRPHRAGRSCPYDQFLQNALSGMFSEDRNKYLASSGELDLLIIHDLGIERNFEYAQEQVYNVVDSRYLSRRPFIITTNLTLRELKEPKDIVHARIYDCKLERCALVRFSSRNYLFHHYHHTAQ